MAEQIREVDAEPERPHHAAPEPVCRKGHLSLYRGAKAVILAPLAWLGAQVRDHSAQAIPLAAAGVVSGAAILGVANPEHRPTPERVAPEPYSVVEPPQPVEQQRPPLAPTPEPTVTATPIPAPTPSPSPSAPPTPSPPLLLDLELPPLPSLPPVEPPLPTPLPTLTPTAPPVEQLLPLQLG
ncbi:MAG: hypothetical protein ACRD0W_05265 [Acidimicrobiales bacterium]